MGYWNKHENIIDKEENNGVHSCPMCGKLVTWIDCESPCGFKLCPSCGFTKSTKTYKLVCDGYGYKIVYEM